MRKLLKRIEGFSEAIVLKIKLWAAPPVRMPQRMAFKSFEIYLPASHLLLRYKTKHPNYDRFLPHLAMHLAEGALVLDVGANVGDSLAAMYEANPNLRFICFEPDDEFFQYLAENIERMRFGDKRVQVEAVKTLVGKAVTAARLEGAGGTKHVVPGVSQGALPSVMLDNFISVVDRASVRLLKSDVDGFDFDVLDSAAKILAESKPLIFFETYFESSDQLHGYLKTLRMLEISGYSHWVIFDNFGTLLLQTDQVDHVMQLWSYISRQNRGSGTRTVHYLDVLAAQNEDKKFVEKVLNSY
jgi:FkbM family methyltransferase